MEVDGVVRFSAIFVLSIISAFLLLGCISESNQQKTKTLTLPHSGENVTLVLTSSSPEYERYGIRGTETIEYGYGVSKGGPSDAIYYNSSTLDYVFASDTYGSDTGRYICKTEQCDSVPTKETFIKDYMNPQKWLKTHVAIVCFANGTYVGFGSGYPKVSLANAAFGGYEHYGIYSYPNKLLFKSLYSDGLEGFNKALETYNKENNASEKIEITLEEFQDLGPSGHSITRFPYELYTLPEKNVMYLVAFNASLWLDQGNGCPALKPI